MDRLSTRAVIEITRPKSYVAMMIPFKVFVDDQQVGAVRNGSAQSFEISAGQHIIIIKQGRLIRSNDLSLNCSPNQTIRLQVTQNGVFRQFLLKFTGKTLSQVTDLKLEAVK